MPGPGQSRQALTGLFQRQSITDLTTLPAALETSSRMSVFRRLSVFGYLSSYSHAGRYCTGAWAGSDTRPLTEPSAASWPKAEPADINRTTTARNRRWKRFRDITHLSRR